MSVSLSPSLLDLNVSFPIDYSIEFDCSESNLKEIIEKVASFTSEVYAAFPKFDKEKRELLEKEGVVFHGFDTAPSSIKCEDFKVLLKKEIVEVLNEKGKTCSIKLSTDYYPETILSKIAESVFNKEDKIESLFPCKT